MPRRVYRRFAAARDGDDVRSTSVTPEARASCRAARQSACPTPRPRLAGATTTLSNRARRPEGIRMNTSVTVPTIAPAASSRAIRRTFVSVPTISAREASVGSGADGDSAGSRRRKASTRDCVASRTRSILTSGSLAPAGWRATRTPSSGAPPLSSRRQKASTGRTCDHSDDPREEMSGRGGSHAGDYAGADRAAYRTRRLDDHDDEGDCDGDVRDGGWRRRGGGAD